MTHPPGANPFEAPQAQNLGYGSGPGPGYGTGGQIDIGQCIEGGWHACWRNFGPWLALLLVWALLATLSVFTVIGAIVVVPVLAWGFFTFTLRAVDGHAEFGELFSGFGIFSAALVPMLGVGLLTFLVQIPQQLLQMAPGIAAGAGGDEMATIALMVFGYGFGTVYYCLVSVRFTFAWFFVVDQGLGAMDAMRASWEVTADQKLMVFLLVLVTGMIAVLGMLVLCVGIIPGMMISMGAQAVAYRQLTSGGPRGGDPALQGASPSAF